METWAIVLMFAITAPLWGPVALIVLMLVAFAILACLASVVAAIVSANEAVSEWRARR